MNKSGNQIRDKMIRSHPKTDRQKLVGVRRFLYTKLKGVGISLEPYMMFTKGEDEFVDWRNSLTREEVCNHTIHPPDIVIYSHSWILVLELDGPIHDIKVMETNERDLRYTQNNIPYVVVNETALRMKLGIAKSAPLPQDAINEAFWERIKAKISQLQQAHL